jgi:hypothetical protein
MGGRPPTTGFGGSAGSRLFLLTADDFLIPDVALAGPDARTGYIDVGHVAVAHHALDADLLDGGRDGLHGGRGLRRCRIARVFGGKLVGEVFGQKVHFRDHPQLAVVAWGGGAARHLIGERAKVDAGNSDPSTRE